MYTPGKILVMGGGETQPTRHCRGDRPHSDRTDLAAAVGPMAVARRQLNATLLPDGTVLVTGGTSKGPSSIMLMLRAGPCRRDLGSGDRDCGQHSPAARASLAFTTLVQCCCPMRES